MGRDGAGRGILSLKEIYMQQPSVGRIVHYQSAGAEPDSTCFAALITAVHSDETVGLAVVGPTGIHFVLRASRADVEQHGASTWHWPERV